MAVVKPLPEEKAPADLKPIYESMKQNFGHMPNFFGMLAHKPEVLKNFLPMYGPSPDPAPWTRNTRNSPTLRRH